MDPDLEASLGLDQSRPRASQGTQKWIRSIPRWIWVDRVEPRSTKWIGPRYNFSMCMAGIKIISGGRFKKVDMKNKVDRKITRKV